MCLFVDKFEIDVFTNNDKTLSWVSVYDLQESNMPIFILNVECGNSLERNICNSY